MTHKSSHAGWDFKNALRSDRGQAQVEFALVVIFLFLLVLGILEMLFFMHTYNVLADSAKEGVRYAIVHGANNSYPVGPDCSGSCPKIDGPAGPSLAPADNPPNTPPPIVNTFAPYSFPVSTAL